MKVLLLTLVAFLSVGCGTTRVVTQTWEAASQKGYPEKMLVDKISSKRTFGIAFSGGGTRAASATLGQLQALHDYGIMKKVDYISTVSGGTWAVVPYVFLPSNFSDREFLGAYVPPNKLKDNNIESTSEKSLAGAISNAKFSFFSNNLYFSAIKFTGDEIFANYLGNIFLKPFALKKRKYFTISKDRRMEIIAQNRNKNIVLKKDDFYVVRDNRPFLIVNSTLMPFHSAKVGSFLPVEITPMYVGIPVKAELYRKSAGLFEPKPDTIVGGYVEPLAYDSKLISQEGNLAYMEHDNLRHGFSLSDTLAASGAAPQQTLHQAGLFNLITTNLVFPELVHWSDYEERPLYYKGKEYAHGDGGHLDNLGLMSLLARQVDNILIFVNTPVPFQEKTGEIVDDVKVLFKYAKNYTENVKEFRSSPHNVVFGGERDYFNLINEFAIKKRQGEPLFYCQKYRITDNNLYNVKKVKKDGGEYKPKVCWVYLDATEKWFRAIEKNSTLSKEARDMILYRKGELKHFPHYWTFLNDLPKLTFIDKTIPQVKLLSNLTAWTVREVQKHIVSEFNLVDLKVSENDNESCKACFVEKLSDVRNSWVEINSP